MVAFKCINHLGSNIDGQCFGGCATRSMENGCRWLSDAGVFANEERKVPSLPTLRRELAQADNVRNALTLVSRGEAIFGIVYGTDARADPKVKLVGTFPASSHSPIVYPVALVAGSANPDAALFLSYLTSQAATKIFVGQGFDILSK